MAKPYSGDLRESVVRAVRSGRSCAEVADMFKIGPRTVERYMALWRSTGTVVPHTKFGGHRKPILKEHTSKIEALIAKRPDATLEALQESLASEKIKVGTATIFRFLKAMGFSYKKNTGRSRTETQGRGRAAQRMARASKRT